MSEPGPKPLNTLLHNTGTPPRVTVAFPGATTRHRALWLEVPAGAGHGVVELAESAGLGSSRSIVTAERKLRKLVEAHAPSIPFPPAAVIHHDRSRATERMTDLVTIITVLAKSSGHVYLRDKEPNFDRVIPGTGLVLLIPPGWSPE